jgi:tRNA threonylcarbamoyladenosine biosynthesis protein TsaE
MPVDLFLETEMDTAALGADIIRKARVGETLLLFGNLGAGKTTFVRGALRELGFSGPVRSPSFNLVQLYETDPPVLHADLYRLDSAAGLDLDELGAGRISLIEWAERAPELFNEKTCWSVRLEYDGEGRRAVVEPPAGRYPEGYAQDRHR